MELTKRAFNELSSISESVDIIRHLLAGDYLTEEGYKIGASNELYDACVRINHIYVDMIARCDPKRAGTPRYKDYSGRGISVCKEWLENPYAFKDWAFNNGYAPDLSLDRINVDGNYCPENCRWATDHQQAINKQRGIKVDGVSLRTFCELREIDYGNTYRFLSSMGVSAFKKRYGAKEITRNGRQYKRGESDEL